MNAVAFDIPGYTLVRELGAGGMATVFLAMQTSLDRRVAIKVMRRGLSDDNVERRFLLEGRTMARLPHPNIVGVYDIVQNESINYIAMEYLDGGMLSDRMRAGLTLAEAISIVVQIAGALQFAHDNGIIHRDLKPANIMFRDATTPVLTDFGIARQQDPTATRLTQTGMMIGTPTYMSPEQATGGDIDGRSDQYSLGVLFFEMLTGHAPFEGETPIQVVLAHLNTPPPALPAQFAVFQPLMDRLLAKDRNNRYPDLRSFTRELKALLTASDALLHRLQTDPDQSASERLRALGFSDSQINTGTQRISGAQARVSGARPLPRSSGPGVRMEPQAPRRRGWWPALGAGGLLGVALLVFLWMSGGDELDPAVRRIVDRDLETVDRLIESDRLVAPPGDNAYERLQDVLQVAPGYAEAQARQDRIVARLRELAERATAAGSFTVAEMRISEALAVAPRDADVLALQKRIETARLAAERTQRIAGLLERADAARRGGRLVGDGDTAWSLLRQAQDLDPEHAATQAALAALTTELLQPARQALAAGRIDEAARLADAMAGHLAGEPAWQTLQGELEQARARIAQARRIDELLAGGRRQLAAGRLAEPAGDNVLATLARVHELDPQHAGAAGLARDVGQALARQAQTAERGGDLAGALSSYNRALQAVPNEPAWTTARQALEQRLGEREARLVRLLADAQEALAERRYFAPAGNSARDALDQALQLAPDDASARRMSAELPGHARDAAAALAAENRIDDALALLAELTRRHPDDRDAAALARRLESERTQRQAAAERERLLTALNRELARRQLNPESARRIAGDIASLQKLDIDDADALQIRQTFLGGITRVIAMAERPEQIQPIEPVLVEIERALGAGSPDVAELRRNYTRLAADVAARERERLAALAGTLVLNAQPWANVESVIDQASGQTIELPGDRSTPLRLAVPPGTYRVVFRHPDIAQPVPRVVTVEPKAMQSASASFPALSSREYLRRAGYAN